MATNRSEDAAKLEALRQQYPLAGLQLETPAGRQWARRMEQSEEYFKTYSRGWSDNRDLLSNFSKMVAAFGTYVAIAYPIIANFVIDMYFSNPDPFIQDKGGNKDLGRILTDVAKAIHTENDTETEMRDAFQDQAWAGFGIIAGTFLQKPDNAGEPVMVPGEQTDPETGEQMMEDSGEIVEPKMQKVALWRISPWRCRFDPKGRRWDMQDHRYWAYDSFEYLGDLMRDPTLTDEDKKRLMAAYSLGGAAFTTEETSATGAGETDPDFIRVTMRTIWSRPDHLVYRMPYGSSFTFTPRPWDEEWEEADMFPVRFMGRSRIPEDEKNTEGFIPMADLTLIRPHVENINKVQGLLFANLGRVIDVYVTVKGALDNMAVGKIEDAGRMFRVLGIDPDALKKFPSMQESQTLQMKDILQLLPTGDHRDVEHMAFMDHEFALIQQILGQGPADRGGVADTNTATESLGVQRGVASRKSANRRIAGKDYKAITRMAFIMIQKRQTLPLRYQATTPFNEKVWQTFVNPRENLKNIDLHFDYAVGSTEPRTREEEFAMRERVAQILLPVFQAQQNWRMVLKVAQDLIEPLGIIGTEQYFSDEAAKLAMQLLVILRGLGKGQIGEQEITADNVQIVQQIPELIAQLAQAILTPDQLAEVEATVSGGQAPEQSSTGTGSLPSAPSAGEAAAEAGAQGSAAAGAIGGMAQATSGERTLI